MIFQRNCRQNPTNTKNGKMQKFLKENMTEKNPNKLVKKFPKPLPNDLLKALPKKFSVAIASVQI